MDAIPVVYPTDWTDYELIDTGDGAKLERFGNYIVNRPDPRILWHKQLNENVWQKSHASFVRTSSSEGKWIINHPPPDPWQISYHDLKFSLRPTEFKHMGVFPEQAVNWTWLKSTINNQPLKVLNLFAYTGGATIVSALSGALVTHVDSVKNTISWAKVNAQLSQVPVDRIRWIEDDAYKFALRESRRGSTYDGIILDPPRFGRGPQGEIWKLEINLPKLLAVCFQILTPQAKFILLNAYTADLSPLALHQLMIDTTKTRAGKVNTFELTLKSSNSPHFLPSGIITRWENS